VKQSTPKIDSRTAPDFFRQVVEMLNQGRVGASPDSAMEAFQPDRGVSGALIRIFARFAEIITDRLNRVPEKNLLAFLDLLGASLLPPRSARAPLTFLLSEAATDGAVVPAGTEVAAAATERDQEPAVFETERELVVTASRLRAAFTRDPASDRYADHALLLPQSREVGNPEAVFQAVSPIEHILYIAHDRLFNHGGKRTCLTIEVTLPGERTLNVEWDGWDQEKKGWVSARSGEIRSGVPIDLKALNASPPITIDTIEKRWLRCRLIGAIALDMIPPLVSALTFSATFERKDTLVENAFTNSVPVDLNRGFYPFGESPLLGNSLYLKIDKDFAEPNCTVTLTLGLSLSRQKPSDDKSPSPKVSWEFWNGGAWDAFDVTDNTVDFTASGTVQYRFPGKSAVTSVNALDGYWVRARFDKGSYGPGAELKVKKDGDNYTYTTLPAAAPLISSMKISYVTTLTDKPPEVVLAYNDFSYQTISEASFTPFRSLRPTWRGAWSSTANYVMDDVVSQDGLSWIAKRKNKSVTPVEGDDWSQLNLGDAWNSATDYVAGDVVSNLGVSWISKRKNKNVTPVKGADWALVNKPAFYLGFELPEGLNSFPNRNIGLYVSAIGQGESDHRPEVEWQYSTGPGETGWASIAVLDATADFTQPGVLEFLPPTDFAPRSEFGFRLYWLRAVLKKGNYAIEPKTSGLLLNTVMARHATRIENEILGSSDGSKNQRFRTSLAPVLEGQRLEVRELEMPSPTDQDAIRKETGEDAISIVADEAGRPLEIWVRWKQAPDFYGSGPHDRHYVLDHLAGEARFGDGISGMIPPAGSGNIRMVSYRTGGGVRGNRPAHSITKLRTTLPYLESVTNYIAASGGSEAETYDSLLERMPRTIRHGGRAVTYQDFEDLAMLASPEVARARSVRFYEEGGAGKVSLIIVPRSSDLQPFASLELKRRVREFLDEKKTPLTTLSVSDPEYVEVKVTVDIAPVSLEVANELKIAVLERLTRFLHPLSGGFGGEGWGFGRSPHDSDLYYLIEAIPGVDYVINLKMDPPNPIMTERSLIASGKHVVNCTVEAKASGGHLQRARLARKRPALPRQ